MLSVVTTPLLRWVIVVFVTILIAIASLFVPWLLSHRRKTLWYRESSYPLVERRRKDERIDILFDGESVPDVYISVIGLWYRGTSAIVEDDYRTPVTIDFGDARVLDAEIVDLSPEGLPARLSVENSHKVIFSPVAMNDNDVVRARVLLTSRRPTPKITGHIVDVKIRHHLEHKTVPDIVFRALFAMMSVGGALFVFGTILAFSFSSGELVPQSIAFVFFTGMGLMVVCGILLFLTLWLFSRSIDKGPL
jgi:hypothetical protein